MKFKELSIGKRDADCYDVYGDRGRVAALRSDFTTDEVTMERTAIPGTWIIRWENFDNQGRRVKQDSAITDLRFHTVYDAFAFYCGQVLA